MFERLDPPEGFRPDEGFRAAVVSRGRRLRRRRHQAVGAALGTVVVMAAVVGVTVGWSKQTFDSIERVEVQGLPKEVDAVDGTPFNVLLVGVDGPRADGVTGERADTMMVVRVEPDAGKVEVVSLPRDLWVEVPGHGDGRLNSALPLGGPQLLVGTVESALGIPVDRYLQVDFDGFRDLVDEAGGVPLSVPAPMRADRTGLSIPEAGCHTFDGTEALALVRTRRDLHWLVDGEWQLDVTGDLGRMARQQVFGRAVLAAVGDLGSNPLERARLLDLLADHVTMDSYWTREQLESLVDMAGDLEPTEITTATLPVVDAVHGGAQVLELGPDADAVIDPVRGVPPLPRSEPGTTPTLPSLGPC